MPRRCARSKPTHLSGPPPAPALQLSHANALNLEDLGPGLDGKGWPASWLTMQKVVGGKNNTNGCPVPVTW